MPVGARSAKLIRGKRWLPSAFDPPCHFYNLDDAVCAARFRYVVIVAVIMSAGDLTCPPERMQPDGRPTVGG